MNKILISEGIIDKLQLMAKQNIENLNLLSKVLYCNTLEELRKIQGEISYKISTFDEEIKNL